ncbi:MAG: hypothetical protein HY906_08695 [Deltaproteobacteria bacterium]|nr:hypothetical protein [Deltaproteobacteria bacterium]
MARSVIRSGAARSRGAHVVGLVLLLMARPSSAADTCTTAKCHARVARAKHLHSAVSGGECTDCHKPIAGERHKFKLAGKGNELCYGCHEKPKGKHVHAAATDGCTSCHNPHGSAFPKQLKEGSVAMLCRGCHETKKQPRHRPVADGACLRCHHPHASDQRALLRQPPLTLCGTCHKQERLLPGPVRHAPVRQGNCGPCHRSHGSEPKLLHQPGKQLCLGCHGNKIDLKRKVVHAALAGADCMACHLPHASRTRGLLRKPAPVLCYDCHDRKDKTRYIHGAVLLGRCAECHDPHATDAPALLRSSKQAEVCFRCHADDVMGRRRVHKPVARGDCGRCHNAHGSNVPKNLVKPQLELCVGCHPHTKATGKNVHAAVSRAGCTACHDPHGTATVALLKTKRSELCGTCHGKKGGEHIFTTMSGKPHPIKGKPDPKHPGRELDCVSCHVMVSSDSPKLFYDGDSRMNMCARCHGKDLVSPKLDKSADPKPPHTARAKGSEGK